MHRLHMLKAFLQRPWFWTKLYWLIQKYGLVACIPRKDLVTVCGLTEYKAGSVQFWGHMQVLLTSGMFDYESVRFQSSELGLAHRYLHGEISELPDAVHERFTKIVNDTPEDQIGGAILFWATDCKALKIYDTHE